MSITTMERQGIRWWVLLILVAVFLCLGWYFGWFHGPVVVASQAPSASQGASAQESETQLATIKQYCAGCHNDRIKSAGVSFEGLTPESIGQHADVFEKAVRKLRGRVMPPPSARQPDQAAIDSLVAWVEGSLDRAAAAGPPHLPDQVVLHRLNRKE